MHSLQKAIPLFLLAVFLISAPLHAAPAADRAQGGHPVGRAAKRLARERLFLYRAVEELNKSREYVQDTVRGLQKQIDDVELHEPAPREQDLRAYLDWYQSYADWLRENAGRFEDDLSRAYSQEIPGGIGPERYDAMADGYARWGAQLGEQTALLEKTNNRLEAQIGELRRVLVYLASAAYREHKSKDKKNQPGAVREDELHARYKDMTEVEMALMELELKTLGDLHKHFLVLIGLGRLELSWIVLKADDSAALNDLAGAIDSDAPGRIRDASLRMIRTYESDIAIFTQKIDEVGRLRAGLVRSGTLTDLARDEDSSGYYERMKSRFEHHIGWLKEQIGAYRADIVELQTEK